jgi:hypothetical protein
VHPQKDCFECRLVGTSVCVGKERRLCLCLCVRESTVTSFHNCASLRIFGKKQNVM